MCLFNYLHFGLFSCTIVQLFIKQRSGGEKKVLNIQRKKILLASERGCYLRATYVTYIPPPPST